MKQKTIIYIDAFNLYYGCLKKSSYKWLDIKSLFTKLLDDSHEIVEIKYFTSLISHRSGNEVSRLRQKTYIKAIEAFTPEIKIFYGHYLTHPVKAKVVVPPPEFTQIYKTEEKGTDVNIAIHLLDDAWRNEYDCAVLVSNDSDLATSLKFIKKHPFKKIGLILPFESNDKRRKPSRELIQHVDFIKNIRHNILKNSQLPDIIASGKIRKPNAWL
jgi:uncharacterized LabA/DUF88 family protein